MRSSELERCRIPSYTLPASADIVEALVGLYRSVLPQDMARTDRSDGTDDAYVLAEMMAVAEGAVKNWSRMGVVSFADGAYLELHARQVGLHKQASESDEALRARIQTPPLAITPDLILQALQQIVNTNGGGQVFLIELPQSGIFLSRHGYLSRGRRLGQNMVIALIPASADCLSACTDALRAKRAAGKKYKVLEYS